VTCWARVGPGRRRAMARNAAGRTAADHRPRQPGRSPSAGYGRSDRRGRVTRRRSGEADEYERWTRRGLASASAPPPRDQPPSDGPAPVTIGSRRPLPIPGCFSSAAALPPGARQAPGRCGHRGPAGIGKTALIEGSQEWAADLGVRLASWPWSLQCSEGGSSEDVHAIKTQQGVYGALRVCPRPARAR
jgi:hypothetical protein